MHEIFRTKFGSHLYGTSTPESDVDWKSIIVPDARLILLNRGKESFTENDKPEDRSGFSRKNEPGEIDIEYHTLRKYLSLLAQGQTGALDMLFASPLIEKGKEEGRTSETWRQVWLCREKLFSRQAKSFIGYAYQQASKYGIKGSRMNAAENVSRFFGRMVLKYGALAKCAEVEADWLKVFPSMEHCDIVETRQPGDILVKCFECCGKKAMFTTTLKEAHAIFAKIYENYGHRARQAKNNQGIDWKALSHAVRIGRQAVEFLGTGYIEFPRPEACHLLAIKTGQLNYMKVAEEIEDLLVAVREAADSSILPEKPDYQWLDDFVVEQYRNVIIRNDE